MNKRFKKILLATMLALSVASYGQAAQKASYFKPASGGYRLNIPVASQEIYKTATSTRFVVGGNQLVNADIYTLPNFIAVPIKQYSEEQKKEMASFIKKTQDFPDFEYEPQAILPVAKEEGTATAKSSVKGEPTTSKGTLKERLQAIQAAEKAAKNTTAKQQSKTATKPKTSDLTINSDNSVSFAMNAPKDAVLKRDYIVGKAFQVRNDKLLVVTVASPKKEKGIAQAGISELTGELKLGKPHYPDKNTLTSNLLGASMELPAGWHAYTLRSDNLIMARTISGVHNDIAMLRTFKSDEFLAFAKAKSNNLAAEEKNFIDRITKFTPNIAIIKHEPVVIDGLNSSIIQTTDSDDLKKIFILNAYIFTPEGIGYQIRFSTDDTINYDLKLKAFEAAIKSFKLVERKEPDAKQTKK